MDNPYREFGLRLHQLRSRRGLSALAVSRLVGCSVSSIFRWEAGAE
ncbi:MAG: helix-turn-helix transcriptional regulator, partial [Candidatus Eremiobacterota bacterium]